MRVGQEVMVILRRSKKAWLVLCAAHHEPARRCADRVVVRVAVLAL